MQQHLGRRCEMLGLRPQVARTQNRQDVHCQLLPDKWPEPQPGFRFAPHEALDFQPPLWASGRSVRAAAPVARRGHTHAPEDARRCKEHPAPVDWRSTVHTQLRQSLIYELAAEINNHNIIHIITMRCCKGKVNAVSLASNFTFFSPKPFLSVCPPRPTVRGSVSLAAGSPLRSSRALLHEPGFRAGPAPGGSHPAVRAALAPWLPQSEGRQPHRASLSLASSRTAGSSSSRSSKLGTRLSLSYQVGNVHFFAQRKRFRAHSSCPHRFGAAASEVGGT